MNYLKYKQIVIFSTICFLLGCKQERFQLTSVEGAQIQIDSDLQTTDSIDSFVSPFRNHINKVVDSTLAYAPTALLLEESHRNTSMGNLMADIVLEETAPVFKKQTGNDLDFVVLNRGGIRAIISAGPVNARTAFEVMPFENFISVVELDGAAVRRLITFLSESSRIHPIAGMQIILDKNNKLESVTIDGSPFDENRNYFVATSDYLVMGGPDIGFFNETVSVTDTGYLIRNAIIDHFRKVDTLTAKVDDRFIQLD